MVESREEKRLFLGLLLATGGALALGAMLLWWLPQASVEVESWLPLLLGGIFGGLAIFVWAGIAIVVFVILFERDLPGMRRLRGLLVRGFFPPIVAIARLFGISKRRVERSYIAVNNQVVLRSRWKTPPERMLILLPHCLQVDSCDVRITGNVHNCRGCGRCPMSGLLELAAEHGVHVSVATGGTLARKIIIDQRPQLIIAVACERDLTSGIQDAHPLPVYGILNRRPEGPCFNTQVDLAEVEAALRRFCAGPSTRRNRPQTAGESF